MSVLVLGVTGMLGKDVFQYLAQKNIEVFGTSRQYSNSENIILFDAATDSVEKMFDEHPSISWVVNCIGIIKTHIKAEESDSQENANKLNSLFPYALATECESRNIKIIQIATDCVYSGQSGKSSELALHDPWDVYGKTKSLGEVASDNVMNIRSSIIGKELSKSTSLVEWVIRQPKNAEIQGYTNHYWNGITTLAFAKVCFGIISTNNFKPGLQHLVPNNFVSKMELVCLIAAHFGRKDIVVTPHSTLLGIDRTISTIYPSQNELLWNSAGYSHIPTIQELVSEIKLN